MKKILLTLAFAAALLSAAAQGPAYYDWDGMDTLLSHRHYRTAYPIAQRYFRHALDSGSGIDQLTAAFYLTTLDYGYSKSPDDSAARRYQMLAARLRGADRAVAQAFLLQSMRYQNRDAVRRTADSVLAYSDLLHSLPAAPYSRLFGAAAAQNGSQVLPPLDSTLFGAMSQFLLSRYFSDEFMNDTAALFHVLQPLSQFAASEWPEGRAEPLVSSLFRTVAHRYLAYTASWSEAERVRLCLAIDLLRIEAVDGSGEAMAAAVQRLSDYYAAMGAGAEGLALLGYHRAEALSSINNRRPEAADLCRQIIGQYAGTDGAARCAQQLHLLEKPSLNVEYYGEGSSQRHRLLYVGAANIDTLHFRLMPYLGSWSSVRRSEPDSLMRLPALREWSRPIAENPDCATREYLIPLPPLPEGRYTLLVYNRWPDGVLDVGEIESADPAFILFDTPVYAQGRTARRFDVEGIVVDRTTGEPMKHAEVRLYAKQTGKCQIIRRGHTDGEGRFRFRRVPSLRGISYLSTLHGGHEYFSIDDTSRWWGGLYGSFRSQNTKGRRLSIVMTDRPVYRLGDTVQFVCMACRQRARGGENTYAPLRGVKLTALFGCGYSDAADTLFLKTDRHGRCSGSFVIPPDGENGSYRLRISESKPPFAGLSLTDRRTVVVESYRPSRLKLVLAADSGARQLGRPVTIRGRVLSFSGASLQGADASWLVDRDVQQSDGCYRGSEVFAQGQAEVGADGTVTFSFTPMDDYAGRQNSSAPMADQLQKYTVTLSVTDADGQTVEQSLVMTLGRYEGRLSFNPEVRDSLHFAYTDYDYNPLEGDVRVVVERLKDTARPLLFCPLLRAHPEARWAGGEEEFRRLFPGWAMSVDENSPDRYPVEDTLFDQPLAVRSLALGFLPSGAYRVTLSVPSGPALSRCFHHTAAGGPPTGSDIVWCRPPVGQSYSSIRCRLGDTLRFELGSPFGRQRLFYRVSQSTAVFREGTLLLDTVPAVLTVPVTKAMKAGATVALAAMREGLPFEENYHIVVEDESQRLNVAIESFRSVVKPGDSVHWRLRVAESDSLLPAGGLRPKTPASGPFNLSLAFFDKALLADHNFVFGFSLPRCRLYGTSMGVVDFGTENTRTLCNRYPNFVLGVLPVGTAPLGRALQNPKSYLATLMVSASGTVKGTVADSKSGEPLPFVNVIAKLADGTTFGAQTDFDGVFIIRNLPPQPIDLTASYVGYLPAQTRIVVAKKGCTMCGILMEPSTLQLDEVEIRCAKSSLIDVGAPETGRRLSSNDIMRAGVVEEDGIISEEVVESGLLVIADESESSARNESEYAPLAIRRNLSTLACFAPLLRTNDSGWADLEFVMPASLTQWQLFGTAWSDDMKNVDFRRRCQTQLPLMAQPVVPRFFRVGDSVDLRVKVSALDDSLHHVGVSFALMGPDSLPLLSRRSSLALRRTATAAFSFGVPRGFQTLTCRVAARSPEGSDGEEAPVPVLSDRERVTYSRLIGLAGTSDTARRSFRLDFHRAFEAGDSLSLHLSPHPIDFAIEALPQFKRLAMPGNIYLANSIYVNQLALIYDTAESSRRSLRRRIDSDCERLMDNCLSDGGWSWLPKGGVSDPYTTRVVLQRLAGVRRMDTAASFRPLVKSAAFLRGTLRRPRPDTIASWSRDDLATLFTLSDYLPELEQAAPDSLAEASLQSAVRYFSDTRLQPRPLYCQAEIGLLLFRHGDTAAARQVARQLFELSHADDSAGMYWVENVGGCFFYQRPVETAALLARLFAEVLADWQSVGLIQQWILKSKQGAAWRTDMATAAALEALALQPSGSAAPRRATVAVSVNGRALSPCPRRAEDLVPLLPDVRGAEPLSVQCDLVSTSPLPVWGAVLFEHEEPIDSIAYQSMGIQLSKSYSLVRTDGALEPLASDTLRVGDRLRVRIDIRCDRDLDRLVLQDQRAAAFEPVSTESGWRYCGGLGCYTDVRNDQTNFYINRLREGSFFVEYDLRVQSSGRYSTGIASIASVYAPEFRANTSSSTFIIK